MFRAVILEDAPDIRHETNSPNVTDENQQTQSAFNQIANPDRSIGLGHPMFHPPADTGRKQKEESNAEGERQCQSQI